MNPEVLCKVMDPQFTIVIIETRCNVYQVNLNGFHWCNFVNGGLNPT